MSQNLVLGECRSEHAKRGDLALAASFLDILKSYWIAEPQDVHADILRLVVARPAKERRDVNQSIIGLHCIIHSLPRALKGPSSQ